jgi:N4-gp56 family major capsid protein
MAADQQYWGSNARGGFFTNNRLSEQLRYAVQPVTKFRQFCDVRPAWGMGKGDKLYFNKIRAIATAGAALTETNVIPAHAFSMTRGSVVLSEYGNSIPYTGRLEALSEFDVSNPIMRVLRDDMAQVLDKIAGLEFKKTGRKYTCSATNVGRLESIADGDTLASSYSAKGGWRLYHVREVVKELRARKIPTYDGANYICIGSTYFLHEIMKGAEWRDNVRYGDPQRLFNGEVGRCYGVRFIAENNYLTDTIGTGTNHFGEAVMFGKDAVMEGVAVPEEIRAKVPTDYGRSKGIAWYTIAGWQKIWTHTDTNQDTHIIHLTGKS